MPDEDIAIEIVGRRPGEKLHEELFNDYERPQLTPAEKIVRAEREPLDPGVVTAVFDQIGLLVLEGDAAGLATRVSGTFGAADRAGTPRLSLDCRLMRLAVLAFALNLESRVKTYGAYAGLAAIVGLAVLSVLYFAQAREVKRLRAWAGRGPERAAEDAARVGADAQSGSSPSRSPSPSRRPSPPSRRPRAPASGR